jgi:hypothetical protein
MSIEYNTPDSYLYTEAVSTVAVHTQSNDYSTVFGYQAVCYQLKLSTLIKEF